MAGVGDVGGVTGRRTGRIASPFGCTLLLMTVLTCAGPEPGDAGCCYCHRSEEVPRIPGHQGGRSARFLSLLRYGTGVPRFQDVELSQQDDAVAHPRN